MIQSESRHTTCKRSWDDVGRVVGSAHADFEDGETGACLKEGVERQEGEEPEVDGMTGEGGQVRFREARGRWRRGGGVCIESFPYLEEKLGEEVFRDRFPVDSDPFPNGTQVRGRVESDPAVPFLVPSFDNVIVALLFLVPQLADSTVAEIALLDKPFPADPLHKCRGGALSLGTGDVNNVECVEILGLRLSASTKPPLNVAKLTLYPSRCKYSTISGIAY